MLLYLLYSYFSLHPKISIIKKNNGTLKSTRSDGEECICFTRDKHFNYYNSFSRSTQVRIGIDLKKVIIPRGIRIKSYNQGTYGDEMEERLYNTRYGKFQITNINRALKSLDILIDKQVEYEYGWRDYLEIIEKYIPKEMHNRIYFYINDDDFYMMDRKNSYTLGEAKQYLSDFINKSHKDDKYNDYVQNINYIRNLDRKEKEEEEKNKKMKQAQENIQNLYAYYSQSSFKPESDKIPKEETLNKLINLKLPEDEDLIRLFNLYITDDMNMLEKNKKRVAEYPEKYMKWYGTTDPYEIQLKIIYNWIEEKLSKSK